MVEGRHIIINDDDRKFLLKGKYLSKRSQIERLGHFFLSKGVEISDQELKRYERMPSEVDDSYISRLRKFPDHDGSSEEQEKYVTAFLWIGGIMALTYVISRVI